MIASGTSSLALDLYKSSAHVIGQEKARRALAVLLERQVAVSRGDLDRSSAALVAGRTGTGKTMLCRAMCQQCGLPFAEVNSTQFTERGYVGQDLPQMYLPLLHAAAKMIDAQHGRASFDEKGVYQPVEDDKKLLQRDDLEAIKELARAGVVLLDEGDKWLHRVNHVTGRQDTAIQGELLKMVEGDQEWISDDADELGTPFDTSKVLHLFCGAFVNLPRIAARRLGRRLDAQYSDETFWDLILPSDFVRMGIIPELAGRLSTHIFLRPLRVEHMLKILTAEGGLVDEYRDRFQEMGMEWDVPLAALTSLSDIALERGTGARGLEHAMWQTFSEALFTAAMAESTGTVQLRVNQLKAQVLV